MNVAEIKVSYSTNDRRKVKITDSKDAYKLVLDNWNQELIELQEEVKVILLNRANVVLGIYNLSKGGTTSCIVDIKLIISVALKCVAHSIILCHNHPSGNLKASRSDKSITTKLKSACEYMDLNLLDHLIITKTNCFSFADEGVL